jgi:hypothetical protein
MNKSLSRCLQLISFIWLIHSPLLFQTVNANQLHNAKRATPANLTAAAPLIAACTPHQQLVIAIMLDIDISLDLVAFGFCQAVIDILRTCPRTEWVNIAISLQLTAVIDIAVKFKAIAIVYPLLSNVVGAISAVTDTACVNVFAQITAALPVLCTILDIRAHAQLSILFSKYGCPFTPAFVNLCLTIQLSLFLNPAFIAVCASLFASLSITLTSHCVPIINNCLLSISVQLNLVLQAVLSIVGGLLSTVLKLTASVVFPCLADVIVIVSPTCPCNSHTNQLNALCPHCSTCKTYGVPCPALQPAKCIFDLISLC